MKHFSIFSLHLAASVLTFIAFAQAAVTIATNDMRDYQITVVSSIVCAAFAVLLEFFAFRKSGILGRCFGGVIILLATLISVDDIRRLPYVFTTDPPPTHELDHFERISDPNLVDNELTR